MYEELIQRLENAAGGPEGIKMAHEAADAIAALQAENAEKGKEIERLKKCRHECKIDCLLEEYNRVKAERDAAVELLRRLPESCCGCKYAVDGEACQCSECDDADTENCTETCPWWCDPCGLCDDKDSWSFCGAQGEG